LSGRSKGYFATADEGDLKGGSRGFTIFNSTDLKVVYSSGNELEHLVARIGHYNEDRSGNKGNEPEGLAFGTYNNDTDLLFVLSERSNVSFVYNVSDPTAPKLTQILPTGVGPEGAKAIPSRNLLVVAAEVDNRADKVRAGITIYEYKELSVPPYPTVVSVNRTDGTPIPFAALSGLACGGKSVVGWCILVVPDFHLTGVLLLLLLMMMCAHRCAHGGQATVGTECGVHDGRLILQTKSFFQN
jgi:hypothetical protein